MSEHEPKGGQEEAPEIDVDRLRAERDHLQKKVEELEDRPRKRKHLRRAITPVLVVLTVLVFTVTVPAAWGNRTILNTDRYVATVAPLADDPAVQASIARKATEHVFTALDVQGKLSGVLPENLSVLAAPLTNAVEGFVEDQVLKLTQSEAFATFWEEANRFAHTQILAILEGNGDTVSVVEGKVLLHLMPIVNLALVQIQAVASDLVGRDVTIPEITDDTLPEESVEDLEAALGTDLPEDFGSIVVFDSDELAALQQALYLFHRLLLLLLILIPVLIGVTLWVSPRKRRTLIQLATGAALGLVLIRRGTLLLRKDLFESVDTQEFPAVRVLTDQLTNSLFRYTAVLLAIVLLTLVIAAVTGPYPWAVWLRTGVVDLGRSIGAAVSGTKVPETSRTRWVAAHRDALMMGVAAIGVGLLFFVDLSFVGLVLVAAVVGVLELALARMRREESEPAEVT
jgi:hypothetical protein